MTNVSFLRHNSFFGPEDVQDICLNIIGVGATGSWVGLLAAKMGWHKFKVWDADIVESHNLPNQIYDITQIGLPKVEAFKQKLEQFNPAVQVETCNEFFHSSTHTDCLEDALFIAVDSLSARKDIVSSLEDNILLDIVLETRMGFTHAEMVAFEPDDQSTIDNYLSLLKDDNEVTEAACNERIITTLTSIVASSVVHNLCSFYSSPRRNASFALPKKAIFNLNDKLTTYNM